MQLEERMILSFIYGVHHYSVCGVVATSEPFGTCVDTVYISPVDISMNW